jgi:ubiquinone/menaquinone biosynthesis C-methylase UbiE
MMQTSQPNDILAKGGAYEQYIGRWSRVVAREFLACLAVPPAKQWLDIGCGTGVLSQVIIDVASPSKVIRL